MFQRAVQLEENPATIPRSREALSRDSRAAPGIRGRGHQPGHHPLQPARVRHGRAALPQRHRGRPRICTRLLRPGQRARRDEAPARRHRLLPARPSPWCRSTPTPTTTSRSRYERQGHRRRALRHWLTYVRLDPVGPWANHAKAQAKKILSSTERLSIVSRSRPPRASRVEPLSAPRENSCARGVLVFSSSCS
jgi:hypothetical protein